MNCFRKRSTSPIPSYKSGKGITIRFVAGKYVNGVRRNTAKYVSNSHGTKDTVSDKKEIVINYTESTEIKIIC
jgi:hypothetical protein